MPQQPIPPRPPPLRVAPLAYASPAGYGGVGHDGSAEAIWREGKQIVAAVLPGGVVLLPPRCVKCNAPTGDLRPWRKDLYWHHPAIYVLVFNLLIYAIVALCVRKKVTVSAGLCAAHRKRRARGIAAAWGLVLLGLFCIPVAIYCGTDRALSRGPLSAVFGLAAPLLMLAGGIVGVAVSSVIRIRRVGDRATWFAGAGPEFLASMPGN
jgi:hypothetical protein